MPMGSFLQRVARWWRQNRLARAEALELAAAAMRDRAVRSLHAGDVRRSERQLGRAVVLERRAAQLRERVGG